MISNYLMPVAVCPFTFSGCRGAIPYRVTFTFVIHYLYGGYPPFFGRPMVAPTAKPSYHFSGRRSQVYRGARGDYVLGRAIPRQMVEGVGVPPSLREGDHDSGGRSQKTPSVNSVASSLGEGALDKDAINRKVVRKKRRTFLSSVFMYFTCCSYAALLFLQNRFWLLILRLRRCP